MQYRYESDRFSIKQVAEQLNVHPATVGRWVKPPGVKGRILSTIRIGARIFILKDDLDKFCASNLAEYQSLDRDQRADVAGHILDSLGVKDRTLA